VILDIYHTYMVIPIVIVSHIPRRFTLSRHRDEKPVIVNPLESALTNREARNCFRILSYENCRVAYASSPQSLTYNFYFTPFRRSMQPNRSDPHLFFSGTSALFHFPYTATPLFATLTKTAGVCTNSSHFETPSLVLRFDSPPHDCLVDYSDIILHKVGPTEHTVHSTARPGSAV
jgi:hypothetical protein